MPTSTSTPIPTTVAGLRLGRLCHTSRRFGRFLDQDNATTKEWARRGTGGDAGGRAGNGARLALARRGIPVLGALRSPYPYLLLAAILAIGLVYQIGSSVGVRVGGGYDEPYVRSFHERETKDVAQYRWLPTARACCCPARGRAIRRW
ncbi:MAG: hypothetical protein U0232_11250 [Thermomicrobiales bacterium]